MLGLDRQFVSWLRAKRISEAIIPSSLVEWSTLVDRTCEAHLGGLALEQARRLGIALPDHVSNRLHHSEAALASANTDAMSQFENIARVFNKAGVDLLMLKGAALLSGIYPEPSLRPMSDVDLLVRQDTVSQTMSLMSEAGCQRGFDLVREDFFPKYHYEAEFLTDSPTPLRIDLHARPFHPLRFSQTVSPDAFWQDAKRVRIGSAYAFVPCDELLLVHLACHATFHGYERLIWVYDLKRMLDERGEYLDWSKITQFCEANGLSHAVHCALKTVDKLFGPTCPPKPMSVLNSHRKSLGDRLAVYAAPRLGTSAILHVASNLATTPGLRYKAGYLAAILSPDHKHMADVYPYRHRGWTVCAHIWRIIRGVGRLVWTPIHMAASVIGLNRKVATGG